MFNSIEGALSRADAGCQLFPHEVIAASQHIVNTLYFLELDASARMTAEQARVTILAYLDSRSINALQWLQPRDEAMREAAYHALDRLRGVAAPAALNARAHSLGLKVA
jgi:hypothetical protein